jgi:Ni/Fe-hydrogenase subunit HybB-like protein
MKIEQYTPAEERLFYILLALGGLISVIGLGAAYYMEHFGHAVTGMTNQVFWGLPHVFGIFLIVAASGVLNVASIGTVFGKKVYKPRGPLSGLLAIIMLAAGLAIIMLDLGRADRLIIAMTYVNLTSVFGWNMILYPVFFGLVGLYLWTLMDRGMYGYSKAVGVSAFIWRLVMTTGTGSIFGFVVARQAYQSAILAPMFIIMSFAWGLAVFLLVQRSMYAWNNMELHPAVRQRLKNLLATFIVAVLYFVIVYHLTNLYFAKQTAFERFLLLDGGIYPLLFWGGYILLGTLVPLFLLYMPGIWSMPGAVSLASAFTILGALCQLYVFIIGGQAFPLELFPGMEVTKTVSDGSIGQYSPSLWEILLSLGGIGIGFTMTVIAVRVLNFLPQDDAAKLQDAGHAFD